MHHSNSYLIFITEDILYAQRFEERTGPNTKAWLSIHHLIASTICNNKALCAIKVCKHHLLI